MQERKEEMLCQMKAKEWKRNRREERGGYKYEVG